LFETGCKSKAIYCKKPGFAQCLKFSEVLVFQELRYFWGRFLTVEASSPFFEKRTFQNRFYAPLSPFFRPAPARFR
jgi:hypothetical protein